MVRQSHVPSIIGGIDALDPLEEHEQLHLAHLSVSVGIGCHSCVPDRLVVHRRSETHSQAEITVGIEELVSVELAREVEVVLLENEVDVVSEELVMVALIPTIAVVHVGIAVHGLVVGTRATPSVEPSKAAAHIDSNSHSAHIDAHAHTSDNKTHTSATEIDKACALRTLVPGAIVVPSSLVSPSTIIVGPHNILIMICWEFISFIYMTRIRKQTACRYLLLADEIRQMETTNRD